MQQNTQPPRAAATVANSRNSRKKQSIVAYGEGCRVGHQRAAMFLKDPKRGNPQWGGTMQNYILDMAGRMVEADPLERERIRGEVVGFCYAIECRESAARIASAPLAP